MDHEPLPQWSPPGTKATGRDALRLVRRDVDHGTVTPARGARAMPSPDELQRRWREAEAILLPGLVLDVVRTQREAIAATARMFERLRDGARFLDELDARLGDDEQFRYAGSTIDRGDEREIERVFVDVAGESTRGDEPKRPRIEDLTARLSWIAHDERDASMRIRFSFGHEATRDWLLPDRRSAWSDRFGAAAFPENAALRSSPALATALASLIEAPHRLSELIVFCNAPGGGAVFHHDADPGQRGVVYAQLDGRTVWLACPRRALAELAAPLATLDPAGVFARMTASDDQALWELFNADARLTGVLAQSGRLFVLDPGDAILLPSHDEERCCWHSIFGTGETASLAHSMAIFDALPDALRDPRLSGS